MKVSKDQFQRLDTREVSEVEVCYERGDDDNGFKGIWYKATFEQMQLPTKPTGLAMLRVKSSKEDTRVFPFFHLSINDLVRPVPPQRLQARVSIKEGCVVDAYHKGGWWKGLVIKEIKKEFMVLFDSPPDIIMFQRKHLRPHLDWFFKQLWVVPLRETQLLRHLTEESIFSSGEMVEVSSKTDEKESVWVRAMFVKEIEEDDVKKCVVKFCDKLPSCKVNKENVTVDSESVRPIPPPFVVEQYKLSESVEAFRSSKWLKGIVKQVVSKKMYNVYFEATKEQLKLRHSDLRPPMEWEDGVWKTKNSLLTEMDGSAMNANEAVSPVTLSPVTNSTPLKQTEAETQRHALPKKPLQPTMNQNGLRKDSVQKKLKELPIAQGLGSRMAYSVMNANGSLSPVTPSPVINTTPLKQSVTVTQGKAIQTKTPQPMKKQNGLANGLTRENAKGKPEKETPSNGKSNKSSTSETSNVQPKEPPLAQGSANKSSLRKEPLLPVTLKQSVTVTQEKTIQRKTPQPMKNQNSLANGLTRENAKKSSEDNSRKRKREETVEGNNVVLPFEKKLPLWKTVESTELFKTFPQSPHFSPLVKTPETSREMSAVGMMLTFSSLIEVVMNLQHFTPNNTLESLKDSFVELEKHGFDVKAPLSRICKMLFLKDGQAKKMEELQGVEVKMAEKESEKVELEEKILELQREKKEVEKEIEKMKSNAIEIGQELEDMEVQFQTTVSAQW